MKIASPIIINRGTGVNVKIPIESDILLIRVLSPLIPPMNQRIPKMSIKRKVANTGSPTNKQKKSAHVIMTSVYIQSISIISF